MTVYGAKSHLQIIGTGCAPVVLGVTFMLITVRVGLGWAQESKRTNSSGSIEWAVPTNRRSRSSFRHSDTAHIFPIHTLALDRTTIPVEEGNDLSVPPSSLLKGGRASSMGYAM